MPLPGSGFLQLGTDGATGRSINSEFGYGNDMASYQGVYYGIGGTINRFPLPGNSLSISNFYSTSRITSGSAFISFSQNFVIPVYNTITITTQGDQGGQAGFYGINGCTNNTPTPSGNGSSSGTATSFGGYVVSSPGAGGGGNGGAGSYGPQSTVTFTNPFQGGSGPPSGATIFAQVGPGGTGGAGGANAYLGNGPFGFGCYPLAASASGAQGARGYISVSWS